MLPPIQIAEQHGCQQCLWLFGPEHDITEVGAMNLFILLRNTDGSQELVTPPLDTGVILPGVTRIVISNFDVAAHQILEKTLYTFCALVIHSWAVVRIAVCQSVKVLWTSDPISGTETMFKFKCSHSLYNETIDTHPQKI